jgi:hypothetical protein
MSLLIIAYYLVLQAIAKRHPEKTRSLLTERRGPPGPETEGYGESSFALRRTPGRGEVQCHARGREA